jgi:hypothetical protein
MRLLGRQWSDDGSAASDMPRNLAGSAPNAILVAISAGRNLVTVELASFLPYRTLNQEQPGGCA